MNLAKAFVVLLLASCLFVLAPTPANAATSCSSTGCDGVFPDDSTCTDATSVAGQSMTIDGISYELRRSANCQAVWGRATIVTRGQTPNATDCNTSWEATDQVRVERSSNGSTVSAYQQMCVYDDGSSQPQHWTAMLGQVGYLRVCHVVQPSFSPESAATYDGCTAWTNSSPTTPPPASIAAYNNNGEMSVQLANFPTGTSYFFCHSGSGYPTGGTITNHGTFVVGDPNQSWSSGLCSGTGIFWIGVQATDGRDYYSNQVALGSTVPRTILALPDNGSLQLVLTNFPTGSYHFACHSGTGYPTGGTITSTGTFTLPTPNYTVSGLCSSGSGDTWVEFSGSDGNDYYSNRAVLAAPVPGTPQSAAVTTGVGVAHLWWTKPASDGGHPISSYTVVAVPGGAGMHDHGPVV